LGRKRTRFAELTNDYCAFRAVTDADLDDSSFTDGSTDDRDNCWDGFLHAPLGSLHILELGGIATRGL